MGSIGLSSYKNGEPRRYKTDWFRSNIKWECADSILDIGCGNGRLNQIYENYFEEIYNIDPNIDINDGFDYENVIYEKCFFEDYEPNRKFDVIMFAGSFYLISDIKDSIEKCYRILNDKGKIIITNAHRLYNSITLYEIIKKLDLEIVRDEKVMSEDNREETRITILRKNERSSLNSFLLFRIRQYWKILLTF